MGKSLGDTKVFRGGVTSPYKTYETSKVRLVHVNDVLRISFTISSKGGGLTEVYVDIGKDDFGNVAEVMLNANRQAAMSALSAELTREIADQPSHDAALAKRARREVEELAHKKYMAAPAGDDDLERLVLQNAKKLIAELESSQEAEAEAAAA